MLLEKSFELQTKRNFMAIKHMRYLNGSKCSIYFPLSTDTIYNDSSQQYTYASSSDIDDLFLVTGIFGLNELTGLELEGYASFNDDEAKIYTYGENLEIPRNSKIEIYLKDGLKLFRTQDSMTVDGLNGIPVYGIHNLVPIS